MSERMSPTAVRIATEAAWQWATDNNMLVSGGMNPSRPVEAALLALADSGYRLVSPEQVKQVREKRDHAQKTVEKKGVPQAQVHFSMGEVRALDSVLAMFGEAEA